MASGLTCKVSRGGHQSVTLEAWQAGTMAGENLNVNSTQYKYIDSFSWSQPCRELEGQRNGNL